MDPPLIARAADWPIKLIRNLFSVARLQRRRIQLVELHLPTLCVLFRQSRIQNERQEVKAVPEAHGAILHDFWLP